MFGLKAPTLWEPFLLPIPRRNHGVPDWIILLTMSEIDIGTVLRKFDDTVDLVTNEVKSYGIRFITSDGRLRTMIARKNVKAPRLQLERPHDERGKFKFNLKRAGVMLLHDLKLDEPRSVKVACITHFRDYGDNKWHRVRF